MTHRSGDFITLVSARANASPERNKSEYKEDHENSKAACFHSYSPQCRHECVDSENLVGCVSVVDLESKDIM
jgi:hypothetical protein